MQQGGNMTVGAGGRTEDSKNVIDFAGYISRYGFRKAEPAYEVEGNLIRITGCEIIELAAHRH